MKEAAIPQIQTGISRHISGTFATNLGCLAIGIGSSVILNRTLGPEGKGFYATLITTSQLLIILTSFALGKSVTFHLARPNENRSAIFRSFLTLSGLIATLSLLSLGVLSVLPIPHWALQSEHLLFIAFVALGSLAHSFGLGALRGLRQFGFCNLLTLGTAGVFITLIVGLALFGNLTPHKALVCKGIAFFAILSFIFYGLRANGMPFQPSMDVSVGKRLFAYGLGFFCYQVFQNLNYRFDLLLVSNMTNFANAGWYSTGTGLSEIIWHFPNAVSAVLFPIAAGLSTQESDRLVAKVCRWSLLIMTIGVAMLTLFAPTVISFLYGPEYLPTVKVIYALSVGIITNGMFQILGIQLAARKKLRILTYITATGLVANILLNMTLIPRYGIYGAGIASSISYTISGLLTTIAYTRITGIEWKTLFLIPPDEFQTVLRTLYRKIRPTS